MEPQLKGCGNEVQVSPYNYAIMCFNGAAAQRLRKRRSDQQHDHSPDAASMEPQLKGCGNDVTAGPDREPTDEASMEPQLKGCGNDWAGYRPIERSEASMEPQLKGCGNADQRMRSQESKSGLQWSRSSKAAETLPCGEVSPIELFASMEPQLKGCGNA